MRLADFCNFKISMALIAQLAVFLFFLIFHSPVGAEKYAIFYYIQNKMEDPRSWMLALEMI